MARRAAFANLPEATRIRFFGWYRPRIRHPSLSMPLFHYGNIVGHPSGGRDR
jgi:hypothetical protein